MVDAAIGSGDVVLFALQEALRLRLCCIAAFNTLLTGVQKSAERRCAAIS